jgi:L-aspartate oxidase
MAAVAKPVVLSNQAEWLVVGAGIAGLRAALQLAQAGRVLVVTKESLSESNTQYAQGGIAVAMGGEPDVALHQQDTVSAGDGLVDAAAAAVLVREGPARVQELLEWGTHFDRETSTGRLLLTREGAHSLPRILHANGDATGREIGRALLRMARANPRIHLLEWTLLVDLLVEDGRVVGALLLGPDGYVHVRSRGVLLASGGAGQVYSDTTNPAVATGDGIAAAARAGAQVADMEFFQFHPTALSLHGVPRFLLSEALRGEGALLINSRGERFMQRYHPLLELAPRDVVARAITRESIAADGGAQPVYLDMRHVQHDLHARFPGISAFLAQHGLQLSRDLVPVRPAAQYLMGGVLVFGARAGEAMLAQDAGTMSASSTAMNALHDARTRLPAPELAAAVENLRSEMWLNAGLLRDSAGLQHAAATLEGMRPQLAPNALPADAAAASARNLHGVAQLIVQAAIAREESRGAHFRLDYPVRNDAQFGKHSVIANGELAWAETLSDGC